MEVNRVMGAPNTDFVELLQVLIAKGTTPLFAVSDLPNEVVGYAAEIGAVTALLTQGPPPAASGATPSLRADAARRQR